MHVQIGSLGVFVIWQLQLVACDEILPIGDHKQCLSNADCPGYRKFKNVYGDGDDYRYNYDYNTYWCCRGTCSLEMCDTCSVSFRVSKNQHSTDLFHAQKCTYNKHAKLYKYATLAHKT